MQWQDKKIMELFELLSKTQSVIELAILAVPTGEIRNKLTDINIEILLELS